MRPRRRRRLQCMACCTSTYGATPRSPSRRSRPSRVAGRDR
ncbi:hypothetical protein BURMUCF1_3397 [Burkholderia multivorans ATCC BAA-247]|nr:hypothetical protein BURMUCF1_3397 [Burkholderia multivorans ATCC BAA-247]